MFELLGAIFKKDDGGLNWLMVLAAAFLGYVAICFVRECVVRPFDKVDDIRQIEGTVTRRDVKEDKYLVFIDDGTGTVVPLEVTDALLYGRFDSADVWGNIHEGQKYRFTIGGSRSEISSWYPNIYEFEEIE